MEWRFGGGKGEDFGLEASEARFFLQPKPQDEGGGISPGSELSLLSPLQSKLALQKQLTKTLAARLLPSPLPAAAALCALPGPLALRPAPAAATTLFPAPILGPALFRAPVGAVRPAGPILFAPY